MQKSSSTSSRQNPPKVIPASKPAKTKRIPKAKVYYTLFLIGWTFVAMVGGQFIVGIVMSLLLGNQLSKPFWTLIYYLITYGVTLALIILLPPQIVKLYQRRHPQTSASADHLAQDLTVTPNEMGVDQMPTLTDVGLAPIGYITYIIFSAALTAVMSLFTWFNAGETQDVGFSYFLTTGERLCAIIATVFVAPIAEELIMRGWLYGKLRSKWRAPVAIIITSLIFAVLHGQWNVGVSVFALSVIMCSLREITGTIWSGMLLHMLSNGIAFYLLYIAV